MTRFVVDCETLLRIAAGEIEVAGEHKLVAPTLVAFFAPQNESSPANPKARTTHCDSNARVLAMRRPSGERARLVGEYRIDSVDE